MSTWAEYRQEIEGVMVAWSLRPSADIHDRATVHPSELPDAYYQSRRFRRVAGTKAALKKLVLQFLARILPLDFSVSEGLPIVWRCSKPHARFYRNAIAEHHPEWNCTILRGSLRKDNPYPPLVFGKPGDDDFSDDDHIVMVEKIDNGQ